MAELQSDLHILVIEDNPGDFFLIREHLYDELRGTEITHARTFAEAKTALDGDSSFDAVLLDLTLPDKDGEDLVREMVEQVFGTPIIVLTGYQNREFGLRTLSMGISDYLIKDEINPVLLAKSIAYSIERNRVNRSLRQSEQQYRELFDLSPQPMWVCDMKTLRFLDVNRAAVQHYGYSRDEFLSMTIREIRPKEDIPELMETIEEYKESGALNYIGIHRHRKKDGTDIQVEIRSSRTAYDGNDANIILANDVTERIEQEKALKESVERYETVAKATSDTVWEHDLKSGRICYNDNIYSMFGYKKIEVKDPAEWWHNNLHPEDRNRFMEEMEQALSDVKDRFQLEYRYRCADGSYKYIYDRAFIVTDENDMPLRIIGAMQDVTRQKEEEQWLKLLQSAISNTTESVAIIEAEPADLPGRKVLYVNEAFTRMTSYSREETVGRTLHFLNGPETSEEEREKLRRSMEQWEPFQAEFINYRKNGDPFWISISMAPVKESDGSYSHWVCVGRDVTERRNREQELQESLREKETLLMEIHHRVKNNLAVVSSMMQLQAFDEENEKFRKKLFDNVVRVKTMATIHEILYQSHSFSRLDLNKNLKELISKIVETLQLDFRITFTYNFEPVELNVNQAIPCSLIVNETVTNILKHAYDDQEKGHVTIELTEKQGNIHLCITDDGKGLPEDFDRKWQNGSMGLKLIETLAGQLDADYSYSSKEKGTVFTLQFKKADVKGIGSSLLK